MASPSPSRRPPRGRPLRPGVVSLSRAISRGGAATRTEAERLIADGLVRLNGVVVKHPSHRVDPGKDRIEVDGVPLASPPGPGEALVVALNKPRGVLVTRADPEGRPTVFSLLPTDLGLLRCVGRLDGTSAGLLLATTDTALAAALEDPRHGVPRLYRVKVRPRVEEGKLQALRRGAVLDGKPARPAAVEVESHGPRSSWLRFTLGEGRNREVRRMCGAEGLEVEHLVRLAYGPVELGDLAPGAFRVLEREEVEALRRAGGIHDSPVAPGAAPAYNGSAMKIETHRRDGAATIVLTGEVDAEQKAAVGGAIRDLIAQGETRLVFDVSGVTFLGSTGVACLALARREAVAREGGVALVNPPPMIRKMFNTLGIAAEFPIFPSREAAVAALAPKGPRGAAGP